MPRSYQDILVEEIQAGLHQIRRPGAGLFLSGLSAGLDIGFGPLLMAVTLSQSQGILAEPVTNLLVANAYAIGFVFVVLGRSELFTEHTAIAVVPVLSGEATVRDLGRLWAIIYVANLVGAVLFALLAVWLGPSLETIETGAFTEIAHGLVAYPWDVTLLGGVFAGWLMGLMAWLVAAGRSTISEAFFVWIIATAIGYAHLPHSIAGSVEVLLGVFASDAISVRAYATFLLWATLGNIVGGSVFVALLKYGHGVVPGDEPDQEAVERTVDEQSE
ncbi:formate/nitrite transporter family protein [Halorientalis brevis]|uniref:Formate/nitrite transporter family protein n=1 Tax=Halorientalis brevis TaxID=1126241 RepID=A0ABD6C706_9EURY|nr:formate/nitrite transporter family protein [Halorientalis brevis]